MSLLVLIALRSTTTKAQIPEAPASVSVPSVQGLAHRAVGEAAGRSPRSVSVQSGEVRRRAGLTPLSSAPRLDEEPSPNRFRGALVGSTFGVGLSAGVLFIASETDWDRYDSNRNDDGEQLGAAGLAALIVFGSAPVGAAIGSGLADEGLLGEVVLTSGLGQVVVGGITALTGAGIATLAGGNTRAQTVSGASGLAVGAALGAALGAAAVGRDHDEALSYRDGSWTVGVPSPSVRPVLRDRPSVAVHVPLVRARF